MKSPSILALSASLIALATFTTHAATTCPASSTMCPAGAPAAGCSAQKVAPCCAVPKTNCGMTPAKFAQTVAMVDLTEIKLGEISQTNAGSPAVKKFGAYMTKSHTEINNQLRKLVAGTGIAIPVALNKKSSATVAKLSALKGTAFDQTYIPAMVAGHTQVLAMVRSFAASCNDPAFKKFAEKLAPVIANHLARAQKVQATLQKSGELPAAQ